MKIFIEPIDLYTISQTAYNQIQFIINRKNIDFQNLIPKELSVNADKEKLERVLVNLLNNAAKYTPNNGSIFLKLENFTESKIKVLIIDSGNGIPKDKHEYIFSKFGQNNTSDSYISGSTGLGLSFCKMAMQSINQEIGLESELGKGSTFWITLEKSDTNFSINPIKEVVKIKDEFVFSKTQNDLIVNYSKKLLKYEFFEVTALKKVLSEIKTTNDPVILKWANRVEDSILNLNNELFLELCILATEEV